MNDVDELPDRQPPAAATGGAAERAFYFLSGERRLFATLHEPAREVARSSGWVLCAPFGEERGFAQRMIVEWARALCAAGHWVLRFDYRGYGDSEGWFEQFTAEDHVADILQARLELERRSGVACRGLWGLRLGATLAAVAAARGELDVALALWEPVVSGERFMENLLRAVMVKEMANTGRAPRTRAQLKEHLAAGGTVITEGHPVTDAIHRSIAQLDLTALGRPVTGPTLVIQLSPLADARPRGELEAACRALGVARLEVVGGPPPWQQNDEYAVGRGAPFEPTLRWLNALAPKAGRAVVDPAWPLLAADQETPTPEGGVERAVEVRAPAGTLRAILHLPGDVDRSRPAVLMVTPGFNCRTARVPSVREAGALARTARDRRAAGGPARDRGQRRHPEHADGPGPLQRHRARALRRRYPRRARLSRGRAGDRQRLPRRTLRRCEHLGPSGSGGLTRRGNRRLGAAVLVHAGGQRRREPRRRRPHPSHARRPTTSCARTPGRCSTSRPGAASSR